MISLVSNEGEENNNYKNNDSNIERKMTVINNQTNDDNQILKEPIKRKNRYNKQWQYTFNNWYSKCPKSRVNKQNKTYKSK